MIGTFRQELERPDAPRSALGTFSPLAPLDSISEDTLLAYLKSLGYQNGEIVYLNEDESPYIPTLQKPRMFRSPISAIGATRGLPL